MNDLFFGPGIVLFALIITGGFTIYTFIKALHLESMAKIEKGIDTNSPSNNNRYLEIKFGMLMVGVAIGLLVAYLLEHDLNLNGGVIYPSFILLFGGLSLIASFFVANRLSKKK